MAHPAWKSGGNGDAEEFALEIGSNVRRSKLRLCQKSLTAVDGTYSIHREGRMNKQNAFYEITSALGLPDYGNDGVAIYNRDCVEGMNAIAPGVVDLTVTSPPYNIGKEYESSCRTM